MGIIENEDGLKRVHSKSGAQLQQHRVQQSERPLGFAARQYFFFHLYFKALSLRLEPTRAYTNVFHERKILWRISSVDNAFRKYEM